MSLPVQSYRLSDSVYRYLNRWDAGEMDLRLEF